MVVCCGQNQYVGLSVLSYRLHVVDVIVAGWLDASFIERKLVRRPVPNRKTVTRFHEAKVNIKTPNKYYYEGHRMCEEEKKKCRKKETIKRGFRLICCCFFRFVVSSRKNIKSSLYIYLEIYQFKDYWCTWDCAFLHMRSWPACFH